MTQAENAAHFSEVEIEDLFLFMGKELEALDEVGAGNIVGKKHKNKL